MKDFIDTLRKMMNQQEYAEYLFKLLGEEPRAADKYNGWEDYFYGLFQGFMPDGEGVAAVFEPLEKGQELLARIMPVYQNTAEHNQEILDSGYIPGYFCPPAQDEAEVRQTGERLLEGLREFARFVEDEELIAALAAIKQIRFGEPAEEFNDTQELFGEAFGEWRISNTDYNSPEQVLDEAYYSINGDYYLSAYLQYPLYRTKPDSDFLRPYFDLWRQGYGFTLDEDCLYLCK